MYVAHLTLHDFRSYAALDLELEPGVTAFVGRNGQGKTNIVESIDFLSRLTSHRVAGDAALVRRDAEQAVVRAAVMRGGRRAVLEVEINPGRSNRARVNRTALPRTRDLIGLVRSVVFSPEDLALVKGDPSERRRFLDDLLVQVTPSYAGVRADYERVLKQRNSLLKSLRHTRSAEAQGTLGVWDAHLARFGGQMMARRLAIVAELAPLAGAAYQEVARGADASDVGLEYRSRVEVAADADAYACTEAILATLESRRGEELDRGLTLVGPHRDDLVLSLGELPVKGYASHGEGWSFALALRLASYDLLRSPDHAPEYSGDDGEPDDPILILDDVFAELDVGRREQLAALVGGAEQVLVTAAVPADVPADLRGVRFAVADGAVTPVEAS